MSTVSKEILDKLRQLSDLLIVIKDSGNNTPQILKELAVEKCSEIYSALASDEEIVEYKIEDTPKEEKIDEPTVEDEPTVVVFNDEVEDEEPQLETTDESESAIEEEQEDEIEALPISFEDITTAEEEIVLTSEIESIDEGASVDEFSVQAEDDIIIEQEEDIVEEDENEECEEEEEDNEIEFFSPKESFKKCSHKKIRSVLSINDIFLYKRELFGNSDVDMTDMFDGIDEAESLEDAMELINEYFGSDVESEEMVIEFVERVKQCFE